MQEKDCSGYIDSLAEKIEGGMSLTFSTWSSIDRDPLLANFEDDSLCPEPSSSCDEASFKINRINIYEWGSDLGSEPKPAPEPEPSPEPSPEPDIKPTPEPEPKP